MRYWITGNGVLGRMVTAVATQRGPTWMSDRTNCDIGDEIQVTEAMRKIQPDVVINCAGLVKGRTLPHSEYMRVNAMAPHVLAEGCDRWKARLVHVSTDCVYSGRQPPGEMYSEQDLPDPIDLYGRSKLAGEVIRPPHLTVRTSFIGLGQRGLLAWLLAQEGDVPGYSMSWWNGLTAPVLAGVLVSLAENERATGLVHVASEPITKRGLLEMVVEAMGLSSRVVEAITPQDHRVNRMLKSTRRWAGDIEVPPLRHQVEILAKSIKRVDPPAPAEFPQTADGEAQHG